MTERLAVARLGRYRVRQLLGSGGMASVYKGYDPEHQREVAIKVITTTDQPPDFGKRFQREIDVVKKLRHPHIVQCYDFGTQDHIIYMVQEFLPGPTLAQRMRKLGKRRLPDAEILAIVAQLADALDFAHRKGVIHRDVKPSNAIYNATGQIVLTDFGIARSPSDALRTITGPGIIMGTPGYVAPEQAISSATLTPACDIYSLGVLLFELLTGQLPFVADTPMGVVLKHLYDEPPSPRSVRPDLPKALDAVVLKALHKEPERRYARASDLARALHRAWPAVSTAQVTKDTPTLPANRKRSAPKGAAAPPHRPSRNTTGDGATRSVTTRKSRRPGRPPQRREASPSRAKVKAKPGGQPGDTAPPVRAAAQTESSADSAQAVAAPRSSTRRRLRVGLVTANVVGALILAGLAEPAAVVRGWQAVLHLLGL